MRSLILCTTALALAACGGNVVIDGSPGAGGSGGSHGNGGAGGLASTSSSSSASSSSSGTVNTCPDFFPGIEAPCSTPGAVCQVPLACCSGSAVCTNGFWKYHGAGCGQPCTPTCGPDNFSCQGGAVCVAFIGKTTTYDCRPNPCSGPLSCSCSMAICAEQAMLCNNIQDGFKVLCDCAGQC